MLARPAHKVYALLCRAAANRQDIKQAAAHMDSANGALRGMHHCQVRVRIAPN